jgi:EAL domain-containing protein (putative c-di-GMP-specific phosphodiesterase class I)
MAMSVEAPLEPVWFQPIADTFERRILAHKCILAAQVMRLAGSRADESGRVTEAAVARALAIQSAARQNRHGLFLVDLAPSSIDDPDLDMRSTLDTILDSGMPPGNVVFEIMESDLTQDLAHSHRIRGSLRRFGFGFALSKAGVRAGNASFQAVADFEPDYIKLDKRLIQNVDQPGSATVVSQLVRMAERTGAHVVAEGVDRIRTLENLWLLGVQFMQGHLFGEPSPRVI